MALVKQVGANSIGDLDKGGLDISVLYELVFIAFTIDTQSMHDIKLSVVKMLDLLDAECPKLGPAFTDIYSLSKLVQRYCKDAAEQQNKQNM
jgi:hypothetical protein